MHNKNLQDQCETSEYVGERQRDGVKQEVGLRVTDT